MTEAEHIALANLHVFDKRRVVVELQNLWNMVEQARFGAACDLYKNKRFCPECGVKNETRFDHLPGCSLSFPALLEADNIGGVQNDPDICDFVYLPRRRRFLPGNWALCPVSTPAAAFRYIKMSF